MHKGVLQYNIHQERAKRLARGGGQGEKTTASDRRCTFLFYYHDGKYAI